MVASATDTSRKAFRHSVRARRSLTLAGETRRSTAAGLLAESARLPDSRRCVHPRERTRRKTDTKPDRERLEGAAEFYLRACYGTQTAARADEFAERPFASNKVTFASTAFQAQN